MCWLVSVVDVVEVERGDDAQGIPGDFEVAGQGAADLAIQGHLQCKSPAPDSEERGA